MTTDGPMPKAAVLYVDDDRENLAGFNAVFRRDYKVYLAESAGEAFEILSQQNIQVLITDQRMPEVSGSELLSKVADRYPDMLRFILTGFSDFDPLVEAINRGRLQGYFSKPLNVPLIKERINNGLSAFYLKHQNQALNAALQQSEARLRTIFSQAAVGIAACGEDGRLKVVNRKLGEMLGFAEQELLDKRLDQIMPHEDIRPGAARLAELLENRTDRLNVECRCCDAGDDGPWISLTLSGVRAGSGLDASLIAIFEDITARKEAEQEARDARLFTENILQTANAMIIGLDPEGRIQLINPAVEKLTGYTAAELMGQNWFSLIVPRETYPKVWEEFERLMAGGLPRLFENPIQIKDGAERLISWSNSEIVRDNKVVGTLSVGIDITKRNAAEQEKKRLISHLQQAQKMEAIGTMAGGIAHDFNNILSPIIGYSELILDSEELDAKIGGFAHEINIAGLRARDLIQQILTFSRERHKEKKPIKLQPVVKEALKLLRASLPATIELRHCLTKACGPVMGDPTQIYQVVINLCTNAFQAMQDQEGRIDVVLEESLLSEEDQPQFMEVRPGPFARLTVSDTGPGIEPAILERIFEPYFTTKRMESGTGLGLSVVHGIVKGHDGAIKVYSELNLGTSFSVYLPRLKDKRVEKALHAEKPIPGGSESILLVDDEETLVAVVQRILAKLGYRITAFTDSREALAHFKSQPDAYDLIMSDMTMPHLTGLQLAEAILDVKPGIPIVVCTGFSEMINRRTAKQVGIRRVLMKPSITREIAMTIREVLDG